MKTVYVGDCGVDDYSGKLYPGGCALNVAFYANQAGLNIDLVSCLGNDEAAKIPLSVCQKIGLTTDYIHILPGDTPKQKIKVLPSGEKKFIGYYPGVLSDFKLSKKDIDFIWQHEVLITLYYTQISRLFNQLTKIKFPGLKVVDFMDGNDFNHDINFIKKYAYWWDLAFIGLSEKDKRLIQDLLKLAKNMSKTVVITLGS
ncbi:MAG: Fructoselysine kinase, partial [Candidatus Beckwithbacteria bacterium GW2011_GWA2_43_10]